jgi:pilus assembly protein FimV
MRTVVAGDTLGKIAAQTRPEGVSLDQMLVALFRSNRDVFDAGNMNRLKAGKILSIPDAETARGVSPQEARREIIAQSADFNAYRQRLASAAAASEPVRDKTAKQAASGKITPKVEDKAPVATGKDKLEVSRTETARDAKGRPLQGRITALEEDLVARERALKEASSRIAELEKNLGDLQKLAAIKSQAGADLQKAAAAPAAKPAEPPKPVEAAKPAEASKPAEPPKPADAAKPGDVAKPAEAPKPADAAAAKPAEAPKPPPAKKVAPPPPPEPEPDFIEENAPLVFGGGALLAALFAWLGISAYRKKRAASAQALAPLAEADLSAHSVFSSTTIAPPPSEQETSQFSTTGMGMAAGQETVDPVVEADTFLAFGRDAQAEEILLEALKTDSQRQAIHMKLLDIYAARKDATRFEEVAQDLFALTGGTGDNWNKVAAMGMAIAPESTLYAGAASEKPSAPAIDLEATASLHSTQSLNADATQIVARAPAPAPATPAESPALDFDLDIGTAPAVGAGPAAPAAAAESAALDFDLDLGAPATSSAPAAGPAAKSDDVVLDIDFDMPAKQPESAGLDFPLGAETPAPAAEAPAPALAVPAAAADSGGIDFDFDLGGGDSKAPLPEMSVEVSMPPAAPEPAPLDLGGISLELDTPAGAAPTAADVADKPEVATKLELAAAYAEMGDNDGARELLQEALAEGSPSQQAAARSKLASLG